MVIDGITWIFTSLGSILDLILTWNLPFSDGVYIDFGTILIFFFVLWYIPKFINLIFGSKKGILKNGRE